MDCRLKAKHNINIAKYSILFTIYIQSRFKLIDGDRRGGVSFKDIFGEQYIVSAFQYISSFSEVYFASER